MKRVINQDNIVLPDNNIIHIIMYLHPVIYGSSDVVASVTYDEQHRRFHTDTPYRPINGPLSGPGEELTGPIREEWDSFIDDCKWLVNELGFTIISTNTSEESKKSEYLIVFGMKDDPCGEIVFDLRISDHPFDATFPDELKKYALEYLKMNKVLDGSASEAGITFQVEKVLVGATKSDSWDNAFYRLQLLLTKMRRRIRSRLNIKRNS